MRPHPSLTIAWIALAFALPAARADDPLPAGAVMRLGDMRWRFAEHSNEPKRYAWLPDSSGIVACGKETIRLFDAKTGRVIRDWKGERGDCFMSVAVSPDGKRLAATKRYGLIYLWDIATGRQIKILAPDGPIKEQHYVDLIAFSPDGKKLVTCSNWAQLWDVATGKLLRVWDLGPSALQLGFSRDGSFIFCLNNCSLNRWKTDSGNLIPEIPFLNGMTVRVDKWGSEMAIVDSKDNVHVFDIARGNRVSTIHAEARPATFVLDVKRYDETRFADDSKTVLRTWFDFSRERTRVSLCDLETGAVTSSFALPVNETGLHLLAPDRKTMAECRRFRMNLYDIRNGKSVVTREGPTRPVVRAEFSAKQTLLTRDYFGRVDLWNLANGRPVKCVASEFSSADPTIGKGLGGNTFILSDSLIGGLRIIDASSAEELFRIESADDRLKRVSEISALSAKEVATKDQCGNRQIYARWDLAARRLISVAESRDHNNCRLTSNKWVALEYLHLDESRPRAQELAIFDATTDEMLWHHQLPGDRQLGLSASSGGQTVATSSTTGTYDIKYDRLLTSFVQIWDLATGEERVRIKRPATKYWEYFGRPLFSPNGRVIVVPWAERTLLFYDALTGKELGQLKHDVGLKPLAFTPDGKRLATGVDDGTILIWEVGKYTFRSERRHLSPGEIEMSWRDLAGAIRPAVEAMARLEESPEQALALFRERIKPAEPVSEERVQTLIKQLGDRSYARREAATRALLRLGEQVHPALREALTAGPDAETRKRIEYLLAEPALVRSPEVRRHLRAIELTAAIATPEAKALLAAWSKGDPAARETKSAKEALERLSP